MEGVNKLVLRRPGIEEALRNYIAEKFVGATRLNVEIVSLRAEMNVGVLSELSVEFKFNPPKKD